MDTSMTKSGYGHFDEEKKGGYIITEPHRLYAPWEYIYENGDVLLKVDQNGPVLIQAHPVTGIVLIKREWNESFSKWNVFVEAESENGLIRTAVFGTNTGGERTVSYAPDRAVYRTRFESFTITATMYVASAGVHAGMLLEIENTGNVPITFRLHTACMPYCCDAVAAPWDKPEWYLQTRVGKGNGSLVFVSRKTSQKGDKNLRKIITFHATAPEACKAEISLERYCGNGSFLLPQRNYTLTRSCLKDVQDTQVSDGVYGYPQVYAYAYEVALRAGGKHVCSQVLSVQDGDVFQTQKNDSAQALLQADRIASETQRCAKTYEKLFSANGVHTGDKTFDGYVNSFLPLQLNWIGKLDRGWMTGMHGVRDLGNDCLGLLPFDAREVRKKLLLLFSCQQKNGWFPRQISGSGRHGQHDLRRYNDGGAVVLELVAEYLKTTDDREFLNEKTPWLDSDEKQTAEAHILAAMNYYLQPENIGEHGLSKIYEGDWLDAVNRAGLEGRGESVMITCQVVMALREVSALLKHFYGEDRREIPAYLAAADAFCASLKKNAKNGSGYYNGMYTDGGFWLFSERDPDGKKRVYLPANSYAVIAGVAREKEADRVFEAIKTLRSENGYKLFTPAFGEKEIPYAGRIATGDMGEGLWENGTVYNHAQGFLARALAAAGRATELFDVILYLLPFDEERHPVEKTSSPPYAIVNCWQDIPSFRGRGGMQFLTGSVAIAARAVYNWMFGITPQFGGVSIQPCLTSRFHGTTVRFQLGTHVLNVTYRATGEAGVTVNGKKVRDGFIPRELLLPENDVAVTY